MAPGELGHQVMHTVLIAPLFYRGCTLGPKAMTRSLQTACPSQGCKIEQHAHPSSDHGTVSNQIIEGMAWYGMVY